MFDKIGYSKLTSNRNIRYLAQQHHRVHIDPEVAVISQVELQVQGPEPRVVLF